ncbi:MAG TPA: trehalose-phosphatase [Caulobacteraceae bacterium]|nr:trehalose-phosphatase [Caulobacteraceae bacterium]
MSVTDSAVAAGGRLAPPPRLDLAASALFLDLDGTLAPMASTPAGVTADPARSALLARLGPALNGAIAMISGRSLDDLDRILEGRVAAASGVHGLVRRTSEGVVMAPAPTGPLRRAAAALADFAAGRPGLLVEDKGLAVALHYRLSPGEGAAADRLADRLAAEHGLIVQRGREVVELRPPGPDKGEALAAFMREPPFAGRRPVFVGDDLTDEAGFAAAGACGGHGVIVGSRRPTRARFALADVPAVMDWLARSLEGGA